MVDLPDVITSANFGEDRLKGLGVAGGQNLPFSIDFDRRPYNTLALPCECVITWDFTGETHTISLFSVEKMSDIFSKS